MPDYMFISVHGRRGQGVEALVDLIGSAAFPLFQVQSMVFPARSHDEHSWGFVKIEKNRITSRQAEPSDIALILDTTLDVNSIIKNAKEKSLAIFNTAQAAKYPILKKKRIKAFGIDAAGLSIKLSGRPSTASMIGALAKIFPKLPVKSVRAAAAERKEDLAAIEEGYRLVKPLKAK